MLSFLYLISVHSIKLAKASTFSTFSNYNFVVFVHAIFIIVVNEFYLVFVNGNKKCLRVREKINLLNKNIYLILFY